MSMANASRVAGKVLWSFVKQMVTQAATDAAKDPKTWANARGLVEDLNKAMASRTPEAKIRRAAAAVRDYAQMTQDKQASGAQVAGVDKAQEWIRRADQIESALSILRHEARSARKEHLARLDRQASDLVAESLNLLIGENAQAATDATPTSTRQTRRLHLPTFPHRVTDAPNSEQSS